MIERDELGVAARGLRQYFLLVANALDSPAWYCEVVVPAHAYVALEGSIPRYPDEALALLWDERNGWAAAIESSTGDDVVVLAYLGGDVLAPPGDVVAFVRAFYANGYPGRPDPPGLRVPGVPDGFDDRLAARVADGDRLPDAPSASGG